MTRRRSSSHDGGTTQGPTFEEALADLEEVVESMEQEHLALEDLVAQYEKGSVLLKHCEEILQSARGRIELITLRNQNEIALEADSNPAQDSEFSKPSALTDVPDDDHDIRLF